MGPLNGVDLARRLHELRPDMLLIFVTNYVEYSLQGYEVQAFRYLLKAEMPQKLERYVQQALTAYRKTRDTVRIFCDGEDVELQPQQILYAEMSARKVCLHLQGADRALLYTTATMADLADLLENHGFVRTHKKRFGQYGAHPRSAKHATVSARRNRAAGQLAHSQRRAENLYAVEEREEMGYWLGIAFSCLDVLCVAVFAMRFLKENKRLTLCSWGSALRSLVLYRYGFRFAYFGRIADNAFKICRTYYGLLRFASLLYTGKFWLRLLVVVLAYAISTLLEFCVLYSLLALLHIRYDEYVANMKLYLASAAITYSLKFLLSSGIKRFTSRWWQVPPASNGHP